MKIAINGFGRIGRMFFRACIEKKLLKDVVAINDLGEIESLAYLLKNDSVQGKLFENIRTTKDSIIIAGHKIPVYSEKNPEDLPWKELDVDLVVECSGIFRDREGAEKHLNAGAKKILISAPAKNPDVSIVLGVNDKDLKKSHKIISMASCTTNCIAPIVKVLNDAFGVKEGFMVTTHGYTADQNLIDGLHKKDPRRGRAAAVNLVPTSTGAAKATGEVIPDVKGKLDGYAIRAPVPSGSLVSLSCNLKKKVSIEEINNAFKKASKKMKGILKFSEEDLVSTDILHDPHSSIFDSKLTNVVDRVINVVGWYDNEWGYSNRLADFIKILKKM